MTTSVAVVGLGAISRGAHLPALLRSPDLRLAAVADSDEGRRVDAGGSLPADVRVLDSLDAVLEDDAIRGVILATPPWATPELAVRASRAGRAVLAEKPVAVDPEAARVYDGLSMDEAARIQVGLTYRHDPAMQHLRGLIRRGDLGDPLLVRAHIFDEPRGADETHTALILRTLAAGVPVIHEGAHVFDWLRSLLGEAPHVEDAWQLQTAPDLPAANVVGARLTYGRHVALVEFGWFTAGLPRCELTVTGDRGTAVLDLVTYRLSLLTENGTEVIEFPGDRVARCFDLQVARFAALLQGAPAEPSLTDGRAALEVSAEVAARAQRRAA